MIAAAIRFWLPAWPAERLGMLRICVGGFALAWVAVRLPAFAAAPSSAFAPVGAAAALDAPLSGPALQALLLATLASGAAFCAGLRFAVSGPVFAGLLLFATSHRSSFGMVFHTENLLVLHVIVLALAPSADALSLDARRRPSSPIEDGRHGWPVRCLCLATVLTYLMAGLAKLELGGWEWISGEVLGQQVAWDNLRKLELGGTHSPLGVALVRHPFAFPVAFPVLSLATLALELGAPLALLGGAATRLWVAGAWLFHAGVLLLMAVLFPYALLGFAFLPFFPLERWLRRRPAHSQGAKPAR